jgi:hypothetical protein
VPERNRSSVDPLRRALGLGLVGACLLPRTTLAAAAWSSRFERGWADWPGLGTAWGADNQSFVADPAIRGSALRVRLHAGAIDPGTMSRRGLPRSGTGVKARVLAGGSDAATLRYRLRFAPGFEFVRGGKLPGLFGGSGNSGGRIPTGSDGFSLRLMWREQGRGEVYAYLPDSRVHGSSLLAGALRFEPGRWHEVVQAVALNSPGRADGRLALWQDGRPAGALSDLTFRATDSLRLDGIFFEVFHGGNDDSWAPQRDSHIDFAEFSVQPAWAAEAAR